MGAIKNRLNAIAGWFQPAYKKIEEWDLPWLRDICRELWEIMDDKAKKVVYDLAMVLNEKYGADLAKKIMASFKKELDKITAALPK